MRMWRTKANSVHIGYFESELEAARAYDAAKLSLHSFRTAPRLNFPEAAPPGTARPYAGHVRGAGPVAAAASASAAPSHAAAAEPGALVGGEGGGAAMSAGTDSATLPAAAADADASDADYRPPMSTEPGPTGKRLMTSRYRGVMWDATAGSWRSKIKVKTRTWYLGVYRDQETAAAAYDAASFYVRSRHRRRRRRAS
jgi:hypothetical protein